MTSQTSADAPQNDLVNRLLRLSNYASNCAALAQNAFVDCGLSDGKPFAVVVPLFTSREWAKVLLRVKAEKCTLSDYTARLLERDLVEPNADRDPQRIEWLDHHFKQRRPERR